MLVPLSKTRSPSWVIELTYSLASRTRLKARNLSSPGLRALRTLEAQWPTNTVWSAICCACFATCVSFCGAPLPQSASVPITMIFRLAWALCMNSKLASTVHSVPFQSSRMKVTPSDVVTACMRPSKGSTLAIPLAHSSSVMPAASPPPMAPSTEGTQWVPHNWVRSFMRSAPRTTDICKRSGQTELISSARSSALGERP